MKRKLEMIRSGRRHGVPSADAPRGISQPGNPIRVRNIYGKGRARVSKKRLNREARKLGFQSFAHQVMFIQSLTNS